MAERALRRARWRLLAMRYRARRRADGGAAMDVKKLDTLPGMPQGFPFAMVLLGIAAWVVGSILTTINETFFVRFGSRLVDLAEALITFGAILQGVLWACAAFGRKSTPPPA